MMKCELTDKRIQYKGKFEVYLLSDDNGNPIYAGQGAAFRRATAWFQPSMYKKFGFKPIISFRVIVESKKEALDLEEKIIEKFKPKFNICERGTSSSKGKILSEETRKRMSRAKKIYWAEKRGIKS